MAFRKAYILSGKNLHIVFQSGSLNGMDFECEFNPDGVSEILKDDDGNPILKDGKEQINPKSQVFEIVANEDYGRFLPDTTLHPKDGDTFVLYNWDSTKLGDTLVSAASNELLTDSIENLKKSMIDPTTYTCTAEANYSFNQGRGNLHGVGDRVNLYNKGYDDSYRSSRIIGYEFCLDIPYDGAKYYVGEKPSYSRLNAMESKIEELVYNGQSYLNGNGGGGKSIYIIKSYDKTAPTDYNVYSARAIDEQRLHKTKDDTAQGTITFEVLQRFLQGFRIGHTNAYSIDANGNVTINLLNSADYDDATQSGFGFYKRKDGKYGLNVTDLSVWGKAYFNNLTIRELTYVGGNLVFSPSAGKIFEVREITDAQGEVTGWKCYLLADDGTTATTNMFEVDDQVRCETFNIKAGVYENVSNKFYWRKITDVSTDNEEIRDSNNNILYDGKKFAWIVISATDKAEGSDNPADGDTIVLMGNRTNTNRMSFVVKETYGDNAPREVGYTNVHSYTLGNGNLVYEISPKKVRFYSQYFEIVTIEGLPIKTINYRGDWKQGDTYTYYDQVTHNGTTWLCVAPEGTEVTSEPARGNDFWKAQNAILDATLNITQSTGEWIDKGETNHVVCSVIRGFEDITDQVTSWNIVRDSGDAVNDADWQNKDKVKNFDGTIDIAWTDDEDDIGDSNSCIFTITAFWGNKVELAKGTISV